MLLYTDVGCDADIFAYFQLRTTVYPPPYKRWYAGPDMRRSDLFLIVVLDSLLSLNLETRLKCISYNN